MTKEWLAELRGRLEGFAYWPALAQRRQEEIRTAFGRLFPKGATASRFSAVFGKPPQRQALAELRPSEWLQRPIVARGLWTAGVLSASSQAMDGPAKEPGQVQDPQSATGNRQSDMADALAVVHTSPAGWRPVERGEYAELRAEMAVPNREGPLTFQVPLAIEAKGVREGHIAVELWANGRRVLEHDAALGCAEGEWLDVGATEAAKGAGRLKLRLRVTNRSMAARFHAAVYLGSVRLLSGEPATSRGRPLSLPTGGEGADGR
jgi:hypothetical protein